MKPEMIRHLGEAPESRETFIALRACRRAWAVATRMMFPRLRSRHESTSPWLDEQIEEACVAQARLEKQPHPHHERWLIFWVVVAGLVFFVTVGVLSAMWGIF